VLGVPPHILAESDGLPFLKSATPPVPPSPASALSNPSLNSFSWNPSFKRSTVYLGGAGDVMGIGSNVSGLNRPSAGVVYLYQERFWKYTDFPNSQAFYGTYDETPDLGSFLFDLTHDPNETMNLFPLALTGENKSLGASSRSSAGEEESFLWDVLQYGLETVKAMYAEGVPSPVDHATPPRMHINLIPNKSGCWVPPDSPYAHMDCGLGSQVHEMSTNEYMASMIEMVEKRMSQ
jgi:hypothetical protein